LNKKYVLILKSLQQEYSWTNPLVNSFVFSLENKLPQIVIGVFEIEFNYTDQSKNIIDCEKEFFDKYLCKKPKIVVATDDNTFRFFLNCESKISENIPLLLMGVTDTSGLSNNKRNITGIIDKINLQFFVEFALVLHPNLKDAIVLFDDTYVGKHYRKLFNEFVPHLRTAVNFTTYENLKIKNLDSINNKSNTLIFLFGLIKNNEGQFLTPSETALILSRKFNIPIYSSWSSTLNYGVVGCLQHKTYQQGIELANMAYKILNGEGIKNITLEENKDYRLLFDYKQLVRFNINHSELPLSSIIINKPGSFYSEYKEYIWIVLISFLILSVSLVLLVRNVIRKTKAEKALKISEEKFRNFVEQSADGIALMDEKGAIIEWNKSFEKMTGIKRETIINRSMWDIQQEIQPKGSEVIDVQNFLKLESHRGLVK
jgi:PAS domain-containing protein